MFAETTVLFGGIWNKGLYWDLEYQIAGRKKIPEEKPPGIKVLCSKSPTV